MSEPKYVNLDTVSIAGNWQQSTVLETKSTVSATVDFVADLSPVSATVNCVASVYRA